VKPPRRLSLANAFIGLVTAGGFLAALELLVDAGQGLSTRFLCYLLLTILSSGLKVTLPGVTGTLSVSFLFILSGVVELGPLQTMVLGTGSALVQIYWHAKKRPPLYQVLFNLAVIAIAIRCAEAAYHSSIAGALGGSLPLQLLLATVAYFFTNTIPIAGAISMTEKQSLSKVWQECYIWALPYYLLGATLVCIIHWVNQNLGWEFSLLAMPVAWAVYRS
jgi:hypothetical protein